MHIQNFISIGQLKLWEFPIYVDNLLPKHLNTDYSISLLFLIPSC